MNRDPQLPPTAIEPEGLFDGLSPAAILLGAVVDHLSTLVAFGVLGAWLGPEIFAEPSDASQEALERLYASPLFIAASLGLGALCTLAGAFVGARRAGRLHVRHGGWIAVTSTLFSLVYLIAPAEGPSVSLPLWVEAIGWLLILPAGMAGGALAGWLQPGERPV